MDTSLHGRRRFLANALLASCLPAWGQPLPRLRNLTLVVPTPAGSQPDLIARWLIEPMTHAAGVPGVVVNRPGASGAIALDHVIGAPPDMGSVLLGGLDHVAYSHLNSNRKAVDPLVDMHPVAAVNRDNWLVVASTNGPVADLRELAALSRTPTKLNYASGGEGTTAHLLTARLCRALNVEAQHVPYKETFLPDLIGGRIQFVVAPAAAVIRMVRSGQLRALVSLTSDRLTGMSDVPSIRELGWPDQTFHGGLFLFAPPQLGGLASQINNWLVTSLQRPEIVARYREAEIETTPVGLAETRAMVRDRLQLVDAMRQAVFGRAR